MSTETLTMRRQHPFAIAGYTSRNFWLLLIPLLRGLFALKFDFYRWAEGAGWDILVVTVMLGIAVWRWYFTMYEFTPDGVYYDYGLLAGVRTHIEPGCITAVSCEADPLWRRFGAVKMFIETDAAGNRRTDPDLRLVVTSAERARLFNLLGTFMSENRTKKGKKEGIGYVYKVSKLVLVIFSVLFSSALSGVVIMATLFSQSGRLIGEKLEQDIVGAVTDVADTVTEFVNPVVKWIPPAGVTIALVIVAGFLISFIANLLRHMSFTAERRNGFILISEGFFVKRKYYINSSRINYADMRQNMLMKLFRVTSVHVSCTGYGKRRHEIPVFVPICSMDRVNDGQRITGLDHVMKMLLPQFNLSEGFISPGIWYIGRFIGPPSLLIIGVMVLGFVLCIHFQAWYSLILFLTVLAEVPCVWLLFVKMCSYCTNGINIVQKNVCIKYCAGYGFHTVTVPLERVAEIAVTQTVFQRMNSSCDVIVYTNSEYTGSHRVRGLPLAEVKELLAERFEGER